MLSKEERILIEVLRVEKGYGAVNGFTEFPRKTGQSILGLSAVTSIIWKNE